MVGFDMGEGYYGELPMTPEQAKQFASDIKGLRSRPPGMSMVQC